MSDEVSELKKEIDNLKSLVGALTQGHEVKIVYHNHIDDASYAFINKGTGFVENIIIWHPGSTWQPPEDVELVKVREGVFCRIGMKYENGEFIKIEEKDIG